MIHLDTSLLIRALVRGSPADRELRRWIREGVPIAMSTVAWAEFLCGPLDPVHPELAARIVSSRAPFTEEDAAMSARLFNDTGRRRGSLADCMIAAVALRCSATLATCNPNDFRRLESTGLAVMAL